MFTLIPYSQRSGFIIILCILQSTTVKAFCVVSTAFTYSANFFLTKFLGLRIAYSFHTQFRTLRVQTQKGTNTLPRLSFSMESFPTACVHIKPPPIFTLANPLVFCTFHLETLFSVHIPWQLFDFFQYRWQCTCNDLSLFSYTSYL